MSTVKNINWEVWLSVSLLHWGACVTPTSEMDPALASIPDFFTSNTLFPVLLCCSSAIWQAQTLKLDGKLSLFHQLPTVPHVHVLLLTLGSQGGRESVDICSELFSSQLFPKQPCQIPGDRCAMNECSFRDGAHDGPQWPTAQSPGPYPCNTVT